MAVYEQDLDRIVIRVVYDGPGRSGKTTNIEQLARLFGGESPDLQLFAADNGHTTFFDWFTFDGGMIDGHRLLIQIIGVPGAKRFEHRRAHILRSADAVVLVCDSAPGTADLARETLDSLREHLGKRAANIPVIVQANKQDLPGALQAHEVGAALGLPYEIPVIGAEATAGIGTRETAVHAIRSAVRIVKRRTAKPGLASIIGIAGTVSGLRAALEATQPGDAAPDDPDVPDLTSLEPATPGRKVFRPTTVDEPHLVYMHRESSAVQAAKIRVGEPGDADPTPPRDLDPASLPRDVDPNETLPSHPIIRDIDAPPPPPKSRRRDTATTETNLRKSPADPRPAVVVRPSALGGRKIPPRRPPLSGPLPAASSPDNVRIVDDRPPSVPQPRTDSRPPSGPHPRAAERSPKISSPAAIGTAITLTSEDPLPDVPSTLTRPASGPVTPAADRRPSNAAATGAVTLPSDRPPSGAVALPSDRPPSGTVRNTPDRPTSAPVPRFFPPPPILAPTVPPPSHLRPPEGPLPVRPFASNPPPILPPPLDADAPSFITPSPSIDSASLATDTSSVITSSPAADPPSAVTPSPATDTPSLAADTQPSDPSPPAPTPAVSRPNTPPPPAAPPIRYEDDLSPKKPDLPPKPADLPPKPADLPPKPADLSPKPADLPLKPAVLSPGPDEPPTADLPPGHVWPVPSGRTVLKALAAAAAPRVLLNEGDPSRYDAGPFLLTAHTFADLPQALAALLARARLWQPVTPLLPKGLAFAVEADKDGAARLWRVAMQLPPLLDHLADLSAPARQRLLETHAHTLAQALALAHRRRLRLDLRPQSYAVEYGRIVYVHDDLDPGDRLHPTTGAALLAIVEQLADDPSLINPFIDALAHELSALVASEPADLGLVDALRQATPSAPIAVDARQRLLTALARP